MIDNNEGKYYTSQIRKWTNTHTQTTWLREIIFLFYLIEQFLEGARHNIEENIFIYKNRFSWRFFGEQFRWDQA